MRLRSMPDTAFRDPATLPDGLRFLAGGGAATRLILDRDWTDHPLGHPSGWPAGLKATLSTVLNSPESMILCWGRDELTFFFNETYFPLLGPRLSWAMGAPFRRVWADAVDQAMPIIHDAFDGRSQRFTDLPWKLDTDRGAADTWFTFSYSRILDEAGKVAGLFIFTNETTARVLADRALTALNETLEAQVVERTAERDRLWDTSPDLLAVIDFDGVFRRVNPAVTDILGYAPEELVGRHVNDFVNDADHDATRGAYEDAARGNSLRIENRYRHKDGSTRTIAWVAAPAGDLTYAMGRDVTQERASSEALRRSQEELRQAQKVEAIGQLTGGVAHDFNNLLTVIRGTVDLLRRPNLSDDRRTRYIDAIADTADRAARLTQQLLAFARRQALLPETIEVGADVRALEGMIGTLSGSRIGVSVDTGDCPCFVNVDRNQLDTAIINMAVNARDAMGGAGTLTIRVRPVDGMPAMRNHPAVAGDFVAISLTDTGTGIARDRIDRIFEPFFTTKDVGEGTGLGLSQVFGFAKQTGGEVAVDSRPGEGATFTLYLPRAGDAVPAAPVTHPDQPRGGEGACILVVEDNARVGEFARSALAELGYTTVLVPDAAHALGELETGSSRFDVVFSDVVMPGMSGVELGGIIRERYPRLPVVLASGYSTVLAEEGAHGFELIHKPYSLEQLSGTFRKIIERRRTPRDAD